MPERADALMPERADALMPERADALMPDRVGALAVQLLRLVREAGERGLIHVAGSERRAEELGRILRGLAPALAVAVLPPWDCLPYDRAAPSREAMGRRMAALRRLAEAAGPRLVVTTPDALVQRVPPREVWRSAGTALAVGDPLSPDALEARLRRVGYAVDERVDEPGEIALRGQVVDLFPAGAASPYRIEHAEGRIAAIRRYDPATQLTIATVETLFIDPASEAVLPAQGEGGEDGEEPDRFPGMEHWLADLYPRLETVFDALPEAAVVLEPKAEDRRQAVTEQIADAYQSRRALRGEGAPARPFLPPDRLYLDEAEWSACLQGRRVIHLLPPDGTGEADAGVPRFALEANPNRAFAAFLDDGLGRGRRVVLAAADEGDGRRLARRAEQGAGRAPQAVRSWDEVLAAAEGAVLALPLDLEEGFIDLPSGVAVIAAADLLGSRAAAAAGPQPAATALMLGDGEMRFGDAVIHMEHGMGVLSGLETVSAAGQEQDAVRLTYKDEAKLLAPVDEFDRIWRYGAEAETVALDRLDGDSWEKRRAVVEDEIAQAARALVAAAAARERASAPRLVPPRRAYERFVTRFPFSETTDQARAIEDTLRDLASGRPMDRLVCGDVGFGKTEVALRAAAAAALAGKQVAVVAPTTVLVRQHLQTFRRRFADLGVEVAHLSRLVRPAEARAVKKGLADGSIRIVVGTQALAGKGVRFQDLGLLVIDEEQRFGAAQKRKLRALGQGRGEGAHVLTLTATPIPRTLQAALVGLQDLSLIATPPAQRRPIRTFLTPFDPVTLREALLRERRRGGQSFLVCPRVEDIAPMAGRLRELVPELAVLVAHGKMPVDEIDESMVRFADGDGDVLLATNIIESGLDVPRANTMLVWRADRFGLSQLHQLRGRVGRGRVRGVAYLLTDPARRIGAATRKRLETLETLDRLGAGFAISARDLDLRGAGDLLGEEQAGHVRLIGAGLYQHLLERAIRAARGEAPGEDWSPDLNLGLAGRIPEDYVPEPEVRINLYARLGRLGDADRVEALADEIEDRFGPMPEAVRDLLALARLRKLCRRFGVARVDAGPQAVALTFRPGAGESALVRRALAARAAGGGPAGGRLEWRGERLVCLQASETPEERRRLTADILGRLAAP